MALTIDSVMVENDPLLDGGFNDIDAVCTATLPDNVVALTRVNSFGDAKGAVSVVITKPDGSKVRKPLTGRLETEWQDQADYTPSTGGTYLFNSETHEGCSAIDLTAEANGQYTIEFQASGKLTANGQFGCIVKYQTGNARGIVGQLNASARGTVLGTIKVTKS